jgi:ATP-dependent Clp protease ATP-binding subunit ClpA
MAELPISLDNLIAYVRSMHLAGTPLENLADAVQVAAAIDEQSDALIGYFVDQARRAGSPWSDIGASMGVSKQAVQKRFVARIDADEIDSDSAPFSRFTLRARHVVRFARVVADAAGADNTGTAQLAAALLCEPEAVAANVIHAAGVTDAQLLETFGLELPPKDTPAPPEGRVPFADDAKVALREALKSALRLGHNYIGTEHILIGLVQAEGDAAAKLGSLGLSAPVVEASVKEQLDRLMGGKGSA